ncbi:hypothetical protein PMAYCL1PPCAC_01394, partial [Pristionchus mayeri]
FGATEGEYSDGTAQWILGFYQEESHSLQVEECTINVGRRNASSTSIHSSSQFNRHSVGRISFECWPGPNASRP